MIDAGGAIVPLEQSVLWTEDRLGLRRLAARTIPTGGDDGDDRGRSAFVRGLLEGEHMNFSLETLRAEVTRYLSPSATAAARGAAVRAAAAPGAKPARAAFAVALAAPPALIAESPAVAPAIRGIAPLSASSTADPEKGDSSRGANSANEEPPQRSFADVFDPLTESMWQRVARAWVWAWPRVV
ncbi:hypothetical protein CAUPRSCDRAFT_12167 [Caulochytrium protostelioides]|uniref:Uncharacterized protein n=1 Tax=Caulochytrium protostelioides TaxID=1555241 RepID=A0A4P9WV10_9FUNG|nr:hypothetical protein CAUPRSCDRAFT_12167 [Caulochytrium protostelioides]